MIGKAVAKQQTLCLTATVFLAGIAGFAILLLSGSAAAQTIGDTWRGLSVASEHRCTPYVRRDYPYQRAIRTPHGVLRLYVPCRAREQPPRRWFGHRSSLASRHARAVTYCSPVSPVS